MDRNRELVPDNWSLVRECRPLDFVWKGGILNTPASLAPDFFSSQIHEKHISILHSQI